MYARMIRLTKLIYLDDLFRDKSANHDLFL